MEFRCQCLIQYAFHCVWLQTVLQARTKKKQVIQSSAARCLCTASERTTFLMALCISQVARWMVTNAPPAAHSQFLLSQLWCFILTPPHSHCWGTHTNIPQIHWKQPGYTQYWSNSNFLSLLETWHLKLNLLVVATDPLALFVLKQVRIQYVP